MDATKLRPMAGLADWLRAEAARFETMGIARDPAAGPHIATLRAWANEVDAAIPSDAAQAPNDVRIPMDIAIDARRMRTLRRLLDAMDDLGNGFPGAVHAAFQDGGQSTCRALDEAATPEDLIHAVPVTPAAAALIEREARALRLLEIAEPILEGAAAGQRVTMAAGTLLRQVRAFLPDSAAPTPTVATDAAAPFEWPRHPRFPSPTIRHANGSGYFTEHQMQGYANEYGELVRAAAQQGDAQ